MTHGFHGVMIAFIAILIASPCCLGFEDEAAVDACEVSVIEDSSCMLQKSRFSSSQSFPERGGHADKAAELQTEASTLQLLGEPQFCNSTGIRAWVSPKGLDDLAQDVLAPILIGRLCGVGISPTSFSRVGFNIALSNYNFTSVSLDRPVLALLPGEGLKVIISGLKIDLTIDYMVEGGSWWNPLWTSGRIHAKVSERAAAVAIAKVGIEPDGYPNVTLDIDNLDLHLADSEFSGTIFAGLLNTVLSLFEETIEGLVSETIEESIELLVAEDVTELIRAGEYLAIPLPLPHPYNTTEADLSLCAISFHEDSVQIDVRAVVRDTANPEAVFPGSKLQIDDEQPVDVRRHDVSVALGQWVVNGFLWQLQQMGLFERTIDQSDIPDDANIKLNTDLLNPLSPNFWSWRLWHGRSYPMKLVLKELTTPNIALSDDRARLSAEVEMSFEVDEVGWDKPLLQLSVPLAASVSFSITGTSPQQLHAELKDVSVTPIRVLSSITHVDQPHALNWLIEAVASSVLKPMINDQLTGYELTSMGPVTLDDTALGLETRILSASSSFTVNMTDFIMKNYGPLGAEKAKRAIQR